MRYHSPLLSEVTCWFRRVGRAQTGTSILRACAVPSHVRFYLLSFIASLQAGYFNTQLVCFKEKNHGI